MYRLSLLEEHFYHLWVYGKPGYCSLWLGINPTARVSPITNLFDTLLISNTNVEGCSPTQQLFNYTSYATHPRVKTCTPRYAMVY